MRPDSGVVTETADAVHHEAVIPVSEPTNAGGFDGIHFDFSPGDGAGSHLETHPPYPPLSGGKKKQKPLYLAGAHRLLYPPDKGG